MSFFYIRFKASCPSLLENKKTWRVLNYRNSHIQISLILDSETPIFNFDGISYTWFLIRVYVPFINSFNNITLPFENLE